MNFFKTIYRGLFKQSITQTLVPQVKIIGDLTFNAVYPLDLLDALNVRLPSLLYKKVEISGSQIVPYVMFAENKKFLASCYAVLIDGVYYGAVVGDNKLWMCPETAYRFCQTDSVQIILRGSRRWIYEMQGRYSADDVNMRISILRKRKVKSKGIYEESENLIIYNLSDYPSALAAAVKYLHL